MKKIALVPILLCAAAFLSSCSAPVQFVPPPVTYTYPQVVTLDTAGVTIKAMDGSFALVRGQIYDTPFFNSSCPNEPTTADVDRTKSGGGKPVRISYPGQDTDLYGILAFCPIANTISGAATRSYLLQVPQSYVDATSGNRVSVVYEPVGDQRNCSNTCEYANDGECDDGGIGSAYAICSNGTDCNDCGARGDRQSTWILYLSTIPL